MATVTAERRAHANSYGLLLLQRRASRSRHGDAVAVIHGPLGLWGENFFSLSLRKKNHAGLGLQPWQDGGRTQYETVTRLARTNTFRHLGADMDTCM
jgi:hypothetical protein